MHFNLKVLSTSTTLSHGTILPLFEKFCCLMLWEVQDLIKKGGSVFILQRRHYMSFFLRVFCLIHCFVTVMSEHTL